jgi:general secretion pathway protein E
MKMRQKDKNKKEDQLKGDGHPEVQFENDLQDVEEQFIKKLKALGYEVERHVTLVGKFRTEHTFDLLARKSNGLISYVTAIGIIKHDDGQPIGLGEVFEFDDKCYNCDIWNKVFIALPELDSVASQFARGQQIRILSEENLKEFLVLPVAKRGKKTVVVGFDSKEQLLSSLTELGYTIEQDSKVKGRTGDEYTFDILAREDDGFIPHQLAIDVLTGGRVELEAMSSFEKKAYDTEIQQKVLFISGELTAEAAEFAQQEKINVIRLGSPGKEISIGEEVVGEEVPVEEVTAREEGVKQEEVVAEGETRQQGMSAIENALSEILTKAPEPKAEVKPEEAEPKAKAKLFKKAIAPEVLKLIPESTARRFVAIPLSVRGNTVEMAMANPADIFALQILEHQSKMRVKPVVVEEKEIREAIDFNYRGFGQIQEQLAGIPEDMAGGEEMDLIAATADAPVANALHLIIDEAAKARASDIHIEPEEDRLRVRYRIDGVLQDTLSLPITIHPALTSRIKIMSDMNIADHLRPQDGQFTIEASGRPIDVRVATCPTVHGEGTVLRLLDKTLAARELAGLGLRPETLEKYQEMLRVPFGMIVASGPTGSGKTTTLYASINQLDKVSRKIITIEDPVEYRFPNINQIQINPKAGLTFATGLRSILRLDPDIILVGEMRDAETARIAIQSALTGHLVFTSLHANDAVGVVYRLLDLGIEPFLVASALIGTVAQRMLRRVCLDCAHSITASKLEQVAYEKEIGEHREEFLYGSGCEPCAYSGYRGRVGMFEVLHMSDELRMLILRGGGTVEFREQAYKEGMVPLIKDGMLKVKEGITTPSEVLRNAYSIEE